MFETSLMDLSTGNIPVLRRLHWVIAFVVGAVLFATAWFILPIVSFGIERPVLQFQSTMLCVFGAATALMIGYAWTDSRREGFNIAWPSFSYSCRLPPGKTTSSQSVGTRRFSSSNQFWTRTTCGCEPCSAVAIALIIKKRSPSGDTSQVRPEVWKKFDV